MSSHTLGPWFVDSAQSVCASAAGNPIVAIPCKGGGDNDMEVANAHLIAAAPDLLVALVDVLRIAKAASIGMTHNAKRIAAADAAIAKARGEA